MATWPTITDDSGDNASGTIVNNANVWNPIRDYIGTAWTDVTYSAGNFTVPGGTWTVASGDQSTYAYRDCGKTLHIQFGIANGTVSGSPAYLEIAIPGGFTSAAIEQYGVHWYQDGAATNGTGLILVPASGTKFRLYKSDLSAWAAATNTQFTRGCLTIEIV
jgi:hypothetical protein